MNVDRRRRQYVPLAVTFPHSKTGVKLKDRFGRDGLLVFMCYLMACKTNWTEGQLTYTSDPDGWTKLGLYGFEPEFSLEEFFTYTGQLKQTRKRRSGHVTDVLCTRWEEWNKEFKRDRDAERSASKRDENAATVRLRNGDGATTIGATEVEGKEKVNKPPKPPFQGNQNKNTLTACRHFVEGQGWDPEATTEEAIREELAVIGRRTHGTLDAEQLADVVERWRTLRAERLEFAELAGRKP